MKSERSGITSNGRFREAGGRGKEGGGDFLVDTSLEKIPHHIFRSIFVARLQKFAIGGYFDGPRDVITAFEGEGLLAPAAGELLA